MGLCTKGNTCRRRPGEWRGEVLGSSALPGRLCEGPGGCRRAGVRRRAGLWAGLGAGERAGRLVAAQAAAGCPHQADVGGCASAVMILRATGKRAYYCRRHCTCPGARGWSLVSVSRLNRKSPQVQPNRLGRCCRKTRLRRTSFLPSEAPGGRSMRELTSMTRFRAYERGRGKSELRGSGNGGDSLKTVMLCTGTVFR